MLTPNVTRMTHIFNVQWPVNAALVVVFFLLLVSVVSPVMGELGLADNWGADFTIDDPAAVPEDSITQLGKDLVDPEKYMLPFEIASVLLMAALVGTVLIVNLRGTESDAAESEPDDD